MKGGGHCLPTLGTVATRWPLVTGHWAAAAAVGELEGACGVSLSGPRPCPCSPSHSRISHLAPGKALRLECDSSNVLIPHFELETINFILLPTTTLATALFATRHPKSAHGQPLDLACGCVSFGKSIPASYRQRHHLASSDSRLPRVRFLRTFKGLHPGRCLLAQSVPPRLHTILCQTSFTRRRHGRYPEL